MRKVFICLALGVLLALAGTRDVPINLVYRFEHEPAPAVVESIQTELDEIMFSVGLRFEWLSLAKNTGGELYNDLLIVKFNGDCDLAHLRAAEGYSGPFGWTRIINGKVSQFIGINCDGVRIFLQWRLLELPEEARAEVYRRALARVLAHELCHSLLGRKHSLSGIGKASYSTDDLLKNRFLFSILRAAKPLNPPLAAAHLGSAPIFIGTSRTTLISQDQQNGARALRRSLRRLCLTTDLKNSPYTSLITSSSPVLRHLCPTGSGKRSQRRKKTLLHTA